MRNGGGIRLEADFFRKANNLTIARERKIRTIQVRAAHVVVLLTLLLGLGYGTFRLAGFLVSWDKLAVHTVRISNPPRYGAPLVNALIKRHCGNILTLDLADLRRELLGVPEIREVALSRILPDTLAASFVLRRPEFAWQTGNRWCILDVDGVSLNENGSPEPGLILIQNTAAADIPRLVALFGELEPLRRRIEYASWNDPYGIELKLAGAGEMFYPGESGFTAKIGKYLQLKKRLGLEGQAIAYADLRMNDRIYFQPVIPEERIHEE
jgi:cell division septal protein FtsQ